MHLPATVEIPATLETSWHPEAEQTYPVANIYNYFLTTNTTWFYL